MEEIIEQPFHIGDKVKMWNREYVLGERVLSPRTWTIVGIKKSYPTKTTTGWFVDATAEKCTCCGNHQSKIVEWDSSWFVKSE